MCNLIPGHMVTNLAKKCGVDAQSRTYIDNRRAMTTRAFGLQMPRVTIFSSVDPLLISTLDLMDKVDTPRSFSL